MTTAEGRLDGTSALVTGATSGLGRAVAVRLARAGANLALVGRRTADLAQASQEVSALGVRALPLAIDLGDTSGLADAVDRAVAELGPMGVLVNAAGTDVPGSAEELSLDDWNRVLDVNLTAPFALAKAVMPHMRRSGGGLIVNISSVAGRRGWANASAYCATKFALTGLTQSLAAEGRADKIRVCVLYPGAMATNWGTFDPEQSRAAHLGTMTTFNRWIRRSSRTSSGGWPPRPATRCSTKSPSPPSSRADGLDRSSIRRNPI